MENSVATRFSDTNFKDYEDYLDSRVTALDVFYLKSRDLSRKLVEHGHKGSVLSREEFEEKRAESQATEVAKNNTLFNRSPPVTLVSAGKDLKDDFLKALAEREEANRRGKMTSLIFIRDHNPLGQEVSGYIDYAHRLKTQNFEAFFSGKKKLMPGRSDLCYYNWKTQVSTSNSSENFEVIYDDPGGLLFRNKRDKKVLNVDPESGPGEDSSRTILQSDLYLHVTIYDHIIRAL
ncbi:cilia- and flagella-associated protein 299 [Cynoglossus semilaevis]|uniref:cilia- and flagella-associated protein 299 n=1 Tax=Cynoglossus semilaevis TaxID=244447 RepID=UPI00049509C4|nr:uncharacterized protein C4orf22 homolog [Cynoglossus semilaevis]